MEPWGALEAGVAFEFGKSSDGVPSKHTIVEFVVYRGTGAPNLLPVWALSGSAKVHTILYGEPPEGLVQAGGAEPIQAGSVYFALALDDPLLGIPGSASSYFAVTPSGEVRACLREQCGAIAGSP